MRGITTFYLIIFTGILQLQLIFGGFGLNIIDKPQIEDKAGAFITLRTGDAEMTNSGFVTESNENGNVDELDFTHFKSPEFSAPNTGDIHSIFDPGLF